MLCLETTKVQSYIIISLRVSDFLQSRKINICLNAPPKDNRLRKKILLSKGIYKKKVRDECQWRHPSFFPSLTLNISVMDIISYNKDERTIQNNKC